MVARYQQTHFTNTISWMHGGSLQLITKRKIEMPSKIFNSILRSRQYVHQVPIAWRSPYHHARHTSTEPSRLSQSLATGFWRTCIALSLLPPAYFVYLVKQRFWPTQSSSTTSLPPLIYSEDRLASPAYGRRAINVRLLGDDQRKAQAIDIRLAEANTTDPHERYTKLKSALEMLDDAGLLHELEERWKEREVERAQQRLAMIKQKECEEESENGSESGER